MEDFRARDTMYAGLLAATAHNEHDAITLKTRVQQLEGELAALGARTGHLQADRDNMMVQLERGHDELQQSRRQRDELEARVAALDAERLAASATRADLEARLAQADAANDEVGLSLATRRLYSSACHPLTRALVWLWLLRCSYVLSVHHLSPRSPPSLFPTCVFSVVCA